MGARCTCGAWPRDTIGEARAPAAVALLAAYPFAVFFSAPYTESLFLLGCLGAIYHFRRDELVAAAAWGLLVGLTRPNGCFLSIVLAVMIVETLRGSGPRFPNFQISRFPNPWLAASAPGLGMLAYSAYVQSPDRRLLRLGAAARGVGPVVSRAGARDRAYGWLTDEGLLHVVQKASRSTRSTASD